MNKILILVLFLTFANASICQSFERQRKEFIITNIGINGIIGGIGAMVNKKQDQKLHKAFLKGFGQGCLGGTIQTLGKSLIYQIGSKQNLAYGWAARITNSIGSSITQNAADNENFWEHWHFNFGAIRFDYSIRNKKFKARVFPSSFIGIITAAKQAKFNLKASLKSSVLIFERDGFISLRGGASRWNWHSLINCIQ